LSNKFSHFDATVLDRLKKALDIDTDTQLANFLGVLPTVIANWRSRERINTTKVISKCESLDIHWILFGKRVNPQRRSAHQRYKESDEIVEKSRMHSGQVHDEPGDIGKSQPSDLQLENIQLKSKVEVLKDVIVKLKSSQSN